MIRLNALCYCKYSLALFVEKPSSQCNIMNKCVEGCGAVQIEEEEWCSEFVEEKINSSAFYPSQ